MNKTLLIIKPDAYELGLEKQIVKRIIGAGLKILHAEKRRLTRAEVEELYKEHRGKPFFAINRDFILSGPVGLLIIGHEGNVVKQVRDIVGDKDPARAKRGTIRGDFGIHPVHIERNLVHASSSPGDAKRELALLLPGRQEAQDVPCKKRR